MGFLFQLWLMMTREEVSSLLVTTTARTRRLAPRMVFSGIVEEMGTVVSTEEKAMTLWDGSVGQGTEMVIQGSVALEDAYIGCSIAVDGVCLTATVLKEHEFTLGLSPETLRRTTLKDRNPGDRVNLERSLAAEGRNSGHYVQGHVDGVASIVEKWTEGDSLWIRFKPPTDLLPFIVEKGYVAVDGTSLTVCDKDLETFTLMLVEHTQKCIVLPSKNVGDLCNIEVDVMAKYAQAGLAQITALQTQVDALERRVAELEQCEGAECTGFD